MSVDEAFNVIQIGPEPPVPSCRSGLFRPGPLFPSLLQTPPLSGSAAATGEISANV